MIKSIDPTLFITLWRDMIWHSGMAVWKVGYSWEGMSSEVAKRRAAAATADRRLKCCL